MSKVDGGKIRWKDATDGAVVAARTFSMADIPKAMRRNQKVELTTYNHARDALKSATLIAEVPTGVASPSAITHLPTREVLVVDDDRGVALVNGDGTATALLSDAADLEGITSSDDGKHIWVVQETTREVVHFDVERKGGNVALKRSGAPKKLGKLKDKDKNKAIENKGWEGIAFLSASRAKSKHDFLLCVHEGNPRRLGIYALPDLDDGSTVRLSKEAKELLDDVADVAVDPKTGHIFVISDESGTVVELALQGGDGLLDTPELQVLSSFDVPGKRSNKSEGLAFDRDGRLWVTLDATGDALVFDVKR